MTVSHPPITLSVKVMTYYFQYYVLQVLVGRPYTLGKILIVNSERVS